MANTKVSQLPIATNITNDDLLLTSQKNGNSYSSKKITISDLKSKVIPTISTGFPDYSTFEKITNRILVVNGTPLYTEGSVSFSVDTESDIVCDEYIIPYNGYILIRLALRAINSSNSTPIINTSLQIKNSIQENNSTYFTLGHWHSAGQKVKIDGEDVIIPNYLCDTQIFPVYKDNVIRFRIVAGSKGTITIGDDNSPGDRGFILLKNRVL